MNENDVRNVDDVSKYGQSSTGTGWEELAQQGFKEKHLKNVSPTEGSGVGKHFNDGVFEVDNDNASSESLRDINNNDSQEGISIDNQKLPENVNEVQVVSDAEAINENRNPEKLIETKEGRIELNKGFYDELGSLRRAINEKYGDGKDLPKDIEQLKDLTYFLQLDLEDGVVSKTWGTSLTDNGCAVDRFRRNLHDTRVELYKKLIDENPDLMKDAKELGPKEVSIENYKEKLSKASTAEEVMSLIDEVSLIFGDADMETLFKLKDSLNYGERLHEIDIEHHDTRKKEELEELRGYEKLIDSMEENYRNAGILAKVSMKMKGHGKRLSEIKKRAESCRRRITEIDNDRYYVGAMKYFERKISGNKD